MARNAEYLAHLRREIRSVRPTEVLAHRPCIEDREVTEAPFVSMLALYVCDMQLLTCDMVYSTRRYILETSWKKLLEYFTPECGVYRACREPYVLVALSSVELIPARLPQLRLLALDLTAAWMCSGPHNVRTFTHAQAFKYLSGLLDRSLVPPPPQPSGVHCIGCIMC